MCQHHHIAYIKHYKDAGELLMVAGVPAGKYVQLCLDCGAWRGDGSLADHNICIQADDWHLPSLYKEK